MDMLWKPKKLEIQDWVDAKELVFARKESEGHRWTPKKWLEWYIYSYIHEVCFAKFPIVLHEWLCNIATQQINFQGGEPKEWNLFLIEQLKRISNTISRAMEFWVDSILEGYITNFFVDTITSYNEAKQKNFQGRCNRYMLSLKTWIKMLICEKVILRMIDLIEKGGYVLAKP